MATYPYQDPSCPIDERICDLIGRMTLAEKIGQMTQIEKNSLTPEDVTKYALGSVLSGGGGYPKAGNSPEDWAEMVGAFQKAAGQTRLGIPIIYGVDAVHGHNNMHRAVIFPHNIGLGATRDAGLVERIGRFTAAEILATNIHWNFAPAVSVPQDIRWGRTYEGFSENTDLVSELGAAYVRGLQAGGVSASVKHFVGDGGTSWNSTHPIPWIPGMWQAEDDRWSMDQGVTEVDEATLREVHLRPYAAAIAAGAKNIMVSYSSWGGLKMHGHKYLLTDVLKGEMGFAGFLISDYMAINQLDPDYYTCVVQAINAGMDMIMVPFDAAKFIDTLTEAVEKGDVPLSRIDDAVRRILLVKFEFGLWPQAAWGERPFAKPTLLAQIGCETHRAAAREAVQKSLVLLKNEGVLPLPKATADLLMAGAAANDIGMQCGGWTIEWQGKTGAITPGSTVLQGVQEVLQGDVGYSPTGDFAAGAKASVGIVVIAEPPYAEGEGDKNDLSLTADQVALIHKVRPHCDKLLLIIYSGRPLIITEQVDLCDAVVAAWLPGSEGAAISEVLFGDVPFTGKLAYTWPRSMAQVPLSALAASGEPPLFPFGYGLSTERRLETRD
ncbi:MAG: glycoside hydrolase family 3 protein [Ardenticatenaceae bacterium]|nr:glycoside hydrolase family 3 protein [Ardenticatenaceae bacterium]